MDDNKRLKMVFVVGGALVVMLLVGSLTGHMVGGSAVCNNSVCEVGEHPGNCPEDCSTICGDSICHTSENLTCKQDCVNASEELPVDVKVVESSFVFEWLEELFD
jgi:hypothetical protein